MKWEIKHVCQTKGQGELAPFLAKLLKPPTRDVSTLTSPEGVFFSVPGGSSHEPQVVQKPSDRNSLICRLVPFIKF